MKNLHYHTGQVGSGMQFKVLIKLNIILLLILAFSIQGFSKEYGQQKIDISFKNVSLKTAFKQLEKVSHYRFSYQDKLLMPYQEGRTLEMKNASINEILKSLLSKTALKYEVSNNDLIVISDTKTQLSILVSGMVKDEKNQPLVGVSVLEKGSVNGTTTDGNGNFRITVNDKSSILTFKYIGY